VRSSSSEQTRGDRSGRKSPRFKRKREETRSPQAFLVEHLVMAAKTSVRHSLIRGETKLLKGERGLKEEVRQQEKKRGGEKGYAAEKGGGAF